MKKTENEIVITREIPGHERFVITDCGRIFTRASRVIKSPDYRKWRELAQTVTAGGYRKCRLDGKYLYVHRLVLTVFNRHPRPGEHCRHIDGDRKNNRIENLQWGTAKENGEDRVRHGTAFFRDRPPLCEQLGSNEIAAIRILRKRHPEPGSGITGFLSRWFGISVYAAGGIAAGRLCKRVASSLAEASGLSADTLPTAETTPEPPGKSDARDATLGA